MIESLPHVRSQLKIKPFREYLRTHGAEFQDATNEWELMRYKARGQQKGVHVIWINKKGRLNWQPGPVGHFRAWKAGIDPFEALAPSTALKIRHVNLFVDASFIPVSKSGGWGAVLYAPAIYEVEASGALKGEVKSSTSAEMRGAANALAHFIKLGNIVAGDEVRIICDNETVTRRLLDGGNSKTPDIQEALVMIRRLADRAGATLTATWVKGHQKGEAAKSLHAQMNTRCDKLAGQASIALHRDRVAGRG